MKPIVREVVFWGFILTALGLLIVWYRQSMNVDVRYTSATAVSVVSENNKFIVVDSGHGFFDAGKTGVNGAEEKAVNLLIAKKVKRNLEQQGYEVRMTRENDDSLYDGSRPDTKRQDMKTRVALMNDPGCLMAVSIHQNSFTEEKYKGAQVFYFAGAEESRQLAAMIQASFLEFVDASNNRKEKENADYYLLKKTTVPVVICECGFLSNREEAALLVTDEYQEKAAWAITVGILRFLNSRLKTENSITEEKWQPCGLPVRGRYIFKKGLRNCHLL